MEVEVRSKFIILLQIFIVGVVHLVSEVFPQIL